MDNSNMFVKHEDALFRTPSYAEEQLANVKKAKMPDTNNKSHTEEPKEDMVNHPTHYTQGEIECIEAIKYINNKLHMEGYEGYCLGNFIKYIWRCNFKNGWEDIDKAIFYLNELLTEQTE